ncbi:hypothetical protein EMCRGX_G002290 [Ephydatia muelleri]
MWLRNDLSTLWAMAINRTIIPPSKADINPSNTHRKRINLAVFLGRSGLMTKPLPLTLNTDFDILYVLRSFPKGSGAGPSGLSAQHLLDAASIPLPTPIAFSLRSVVNLLVSGKVPLPVSVFLAGGKLVALNKIRGGQPTDVRPIAVGETLRRLTGRIWSQLGVHQGDPLGPMLFPLVLHILVSSIKADDECLNISQQNWYLDDGVIAGDRQAVAHALDLMTESIKHDSFQCQPCTFAGSWITATPSRGLNLHLDQAECQVALRWWLGLDTARGSSCPYCPDTILDPLGLIQTWGFVVTWHNLLRDILAGFCHKAHLPVRIEVRYGLGRVNINSCPADILIQAAQAAEKRKDASNDAKCEDSQWSLMETGVRRLVMSSIALLLCLLLDIQSRSLFRFPSSQLTISLPLNSSADQSVGRKSKSRSGRRCHIEFLHQN